MLNDRAAVYNLARNKGRPGTLFRMTRSINSETGKVTKSFTAVELKKLVRMPMMVRSPAVPMAGQGDRPFGYTSTDALFLLQESCLGPLVPVPEDYFVQDGTKFVIVEVDTFSYPGGILFKTTRVDGEAAPQLLTIRLKDVLVIEEGVTNG